MTEVKDAVYRLEESLYRLAFELVYSDYVPLPKGVGDYYEFYNLIEDWYGADEGRACERCPLVLNEDGEVAAICTRYEDCWDDLMALCEAASCDCLVTKSWAKQNLSLLNECYGEKK